MTPFIRFANATLALIAMAFLCAGHCEATQRTFVSVSGNDASPCSAAAPCRSFAVALTHTDSAGEVIVLDTGGYGPMQITQAVSIIAPPGIYAGVSVTGASSLIVNAAATDDVVLRGLSITALGNAAVGVHFASGGALTIDRCTIVGAYTVSAIYISGPTDARVLVSDTTISGAERGIEFIPVASEPLQLAITRTTLSDVNIGLYITGNAQVLVDESRLIGRGPAVVNTGILIIPDPSRTPSVVHVANSLVSGFGYGVRALPTAIGASATATIAASELSFNTNALAATNNGRIALTQTRVVNNGVVAFTSVGGVVSSSGNNYAAHNAGPGSPVAGPTGQF